jgi:hypothetical protein
MIERLAVWYLARRGRVVLPFPFIGMAMGFGIAIKIGDDDAYTTWNVSIPKIGRIVALNNSVVTTAHDHE